MKNARSLVALGVFGMLSAAGCELAVDFDRTKIDSGTFDASISETSTTDGPIGMDAQGDGNVADGPTTDAADSGDATIADSSDGAAADADDGSDGADE